MKHIKVLTTRTNREGPVTAISEGKIERYACKLLENSKNC